MAQNLKKVKDEKAPAPEKKKGGKYVDLAPKAATLVHEAMVRLGEAIFHPSKYEWKKYQGPGYSLDWRGKSVQINPGDTFGIRAATSKKDQGKSRIILPHMGQNKVMSVPKEHAAHLHQNSKAFPQMQRAVSETRVLKSFKTILREQKS